MRQRLVAREPVALHGVGGLRGAVARLEVGRSRSRQTSRVEHGLRLRTRRTRLRQKKKRNARHKSNLVATDVTMMSYHDVTSPSQKRFMFGCRVKSQNR